MGIASHKAPLVMDDDFIYHGLMIIWQKILCLFTVVYHMVFIYCHKMQHTNHMAKD